MTNADRVIELLRREQARIVADFERLEPATIFRKSSWTRDELGGGTACILEDGATFERAGVAVSVVHGQRTPAVLTKTHPDLEGKPYLATGISMILHPRNPYAPSFHANFRYFEIAGGSGENWWFGGGADLTPAYGFEEDAQHFHSTLKACCDRHDPSWYPQWKQQCDDYFYLKHRHEMRGVGGIFFDRLTSSGSAHWQDCFRFIADAVAAIVPAYSPIVRRRSAMPYGQRERDWQLLRRGRYVEFNLVYDRGTLFGLQTNGNIESILMSMPARASWAFDVRPQPGSPEADLARFLQPHDWASEAHVVSA